MWRCGTCGQHWDPYRRATVVTYRAWATKHDEVTPSWWAPPTASAPLLPAFTLGPGAAPEALARWDGEGGSPAPVAAANAEHRTLTT